ncbi:MAG: succinyldiaminopimelate transaminase [Betaproteobacteria bacterium]
MNPDLARLQPYPFQKLSRLFEDVTPNRSLPPINLSIGEPKHPTPPVVLDALRNNLAGLAVYPATLGSATLRSAIANWIGRRYGITPPDPVTEILPVNGSREALFSFAHSIIDRSAGTPAVLMPNPFYQIYEGAALLAGAEPVFVNQSPEAGFRCDFDRIDAGTWARTQLVYVCSPGNPTGRIMELSEWETLFALSDRYGFIIAADECYSEIYFDEGKPPLGALEAAARLGRTGFPRLVMFGSLSKRSNVPGMRTGFVAGDRQAIASFLLYRTYHGSAMSLTVQAASEAAWQDESHVIDNRRLYGEKFRAFVDIVNPVCSVTMPEAAFYLWQRVPGDDTVFARRLLEQYNVTVLPGSFLARKAEGVNPGKGFVRIALVAPLAECVEAANRIADFISQPY